MNTNYDEILKAGIANNAAPGATAIVVNRDGVVWEGAAGERIAGSGVAMTTDTVGAIFSMTKAITGAAAMQLVEQGKLDLDAPAGNVCPWLNEAQVLDGFDDAGKPKMRAPKSPITLRQLLTHTSGFTYEIWNANEADWKEFTGAPSLFTLENRALQAPLAFDPGTQWEYGIGIDWAGKMIEVASGMSLGEYFATKLTGPLGMKDTAFAHSPSMLERAAGVHARMPDGSLAPIELPPPENPEFEMGGGGLHGTMSDYGRFIRMILNDGELDGTRILKAETVQMMSQNQIGSLRVKELTTVAPTLMWAGLANSFYWIDRQNGVGGAYLSQILPFGDEKSLSLFLDIERATYDAQ